MSVSQVNFQALNDLRPANAVFGEVTCIELHVQTLSDMDPVFLGYTKRKSIHVPPSSNAYWNYFNLQALVTAFCSERGIVREDRKALYASLRNMVRRIHRHSLVEAYEFKWDQATQYYRLDLIFTDVNPSGKGRSDESYRVQAVVSDVQNRNVLFAECCVVEV
jgi:hypothetical protein